MTEVALIRSPRLIKRVTTMLLDEQMLIRDVAKKLHISIATVHVIAHRSGLAKRWVRVGESVHANGTKFTAKRGERSAS
jgi:transposase-like protein